MQRNDFDDDYINSNKSSKVIEFNDCKYRRLKILIDIIVILGIRAEVRECYSVVFWTKGGSEDCKIPDQNRSYTE